MFGGHIHSAVVMFTGDFIEYLFFLDPFFVFRDSYYLLLQLNKKSFYRFARFFNTHVFLLYLLQYFLE